MAWQESLKQADELYQKGRFQESRELLGATIAELDGQGQQQELSDACLMLGRVSLWLDQLDEAETNLDRARALRSDLHGEESVPVSEVDIWRADLLLARDLKDDAQKTIARAIQVMTDKLGPFNAQVAYGLNTE